MGRTLIGTALAVMAMAAFAGSASAAVVVERVAPFTDLSSTDKAVRATCPPGKRVLSVGGDTTPGAGHVLLDIIRPDPDLTGAAVTAREDETGTSAEWFVQAFVVCDYPPPGLERVAVTSAANSTPKREVTAACPAGKKLLGSGAEVNSSNGQVLLEDIRPLSGLTGVLVNASEDQTGNPGTWSLTAYAICSKPVAGLQRVSASSPVNSSSDRVVTVTCPTGKQVVGVGGDVNSSNGQVVLDAAFPDIPLTGAGYAASEDDTGNTKNWSLTVYAICAASLQRKTVSASRQSPPTYSLADRCAPGTTLTGVGGDLTGALGQAQLQWLAPASDLRHIFVAASEDQTGTDARWAPRSYGICGTPLPGLEWVTGVSATDSAPGKGATAACPAGKRAVGGGGAVERLSGDPSQVLLDGVTPNPSLTAVQATGSEDADRTDENWSVTAYALCANPVAGLQRVVASSPADSEELQVVTATCPAGKHLLSAGGEIVNGSGAVLLDDLRPDAGLTSVTVTAVEGEQGTDFNWSASAYAICADY